eukprot:Hpha_TRINITY_DN15542_c0_g1::TRINITY_DN15542_c0_g1_i1::g.108910::m.108910
MALDFGVNNIPRGERDDELSTRRIALWVRGNLRFRLIFDRACSSSFSSPSRFSLSRSSMACDCSGDRCTRTVFPRRGGANEVEVSRIEDARPIDGSPTSDGLEECGTE